MSRIRPIKIIIGEDRETGELCLFDFAQYRFISHKRVHNVLKAVKMMVESLEKNEGIKTASEATTLGPDQRVLGQTVILDPLTAAMLK